MHRFSHPSDWLFPALILIGAFTSILVHAFRYLGWPLPAYYIYVVHLAVMVPMLVREVPFGKCSHLALRPLAIYLEGVKDRDGGNVPQRQCPLSCKVGNEGDAKSGPDGTHNCLGVAQFQGNIEIIFRNAMFGQLRE